MTIGIHFSLVSARIRPLASASSPAKKPHYSKHAAKLSITHKYLTLIADLS
jgi:hypothetical protein